MLLLLVATMGNLDNATILSTNFLNSLRLFSDLPEHQLKLKVKVCTVLILLRYMDINTTHCNETRYLVKKIGNYWLVLQKLNAIGDDKLR